MGWYIAPTVGKGEGQICQECEHVDCGQTRKMLAKCTVCKEVIAPGERIYLHEGDKASHALCTERKRKGE